MRGGVINARGDNVQLVYTVVKHSVVKHSVINRFEQTWACFCCGCPYFGFTRPVFFCGAFHLYRLSLTRAQWLWGFNLVCFLAHFTMAYLCMTACGGDRFGTTINEHCTAKGMEIPIFRVSSNWTDSGADGYKMTFKENGSVRFDIAVAWFFIVSAIFHSFPVVFGPHDRFAFAYWACINNAFCYWRWIEYTISAPLMFFCLQLTIGIRDQSTLSLSWTLLATVMLCGLATEAWSRPAERDDTGYRGWVGDPPRTPEITKLVYQNRMWSQRNYLNHPGLQAPKQLTFNERLILRDYARAYTANYLYRLLPHFIGWVPYLVVWYQYFFHFVSQLNDLRIQDEDIFDRVPDFVPWAVGATCIWFTSFTFVQWRYQYVSPDEYYKTELIYCFLSAGSKLTLGLFLYISVLMYASFGEAINDTPANRRDGTASPAGSAHSDA